MFDAIIVGAGPAGSVAATVLARGGARVLLLDRARFPRPKLCGDTINPGAVAILRRLGLLGTLESRAIAVRGMIVTGERGVAIRCAYEDGVCGLAVTRDVLDASLAEAAAGSGARFEDGVLVRGPLVDDRAGSRRVRGVILAGRDGRDLRVPAPLVIAADGRRSRLAIGLELARQPARPRRWAIGAYFGEVSGMSNLGEMHVRRGRYIGLASVPGGATNVCVVVPHSPALRDPAAVLSAAVAEDALLRDRFTRARRISPTAVIGPLALDASAAGLPGLLLAGDASGFIDPMTGDGLRFALRGGELAGAAALAALAGLPDPHARLARERRREFAAKWRFDRALRRVVEHPVSVNAATLAAHAAPWILRHTVAFAGDVAR